jgi:hypothetical protein
MYSINIKNGTEKQIDNAFLAQFQAKSVAGFYWINDPAGTYNNPKTVQYFFKRPTALGLSF